ncbi:MAG TPA: 30S ribosomal protein S16, partial [Parachlamydiaceae bacterium]|nr:30S ribosomal protein S16 [Parachlamydiaceae bacterium]
MALKIRLRQQGQLNRPFYRVVVTDCRSPRDGKYLEA